MKHNLILAAAVSLAMASTAMAQTSSGTSDTTSGATTGTSATTSGSAAGMLQMSEAEKSTTANWSGEIADAFFADSTMTKLKSGADIRAGWAELTTEQQAQVEQDCNTMQTASADPSAMPSTGTSGDTSATTGTTTGTSGTSGETTASTDTSGAATGTTVTDPMTIAQLCELVESM